LWDIAANYQLAEGVALAEDVGGGDDGIWVTS
jgi:hypothetical protein